ncbi:hypothetical protein ACIP98_14780 [Streptomyces sp. NPDC088354]|uniref:hypothetical protein n=1 Tax=Streptomyces sp. NPDC088354 TaxID=3365856 RepID=UPI0037FD06FA
MRTHLTAAVLTGAALLLALTACTSGGGDSGTPADSPAPAPTLTTSPTAAGSPVPDIADLMPDEPTGARRTALLAALKAIDPAFAKDADQAIANAREQCATISGGGNAVDSARSRFGSGGHQVTEDQAEAINEALRKTLCTS